MIQRTKNIMVITGFVLLLIAAYFLAISKTIALKNQHKKLQQESLLFKNYTHELTMLKQQQNHYKKLFKEHKVEEGSLQNNLLKTINQLARKNKVRVVNFIEPHKFPHHNLMVKTYMFSLEGEYNNIIKLVYYLEQQTVFGEIVSLHFEKKRNYRLNKYYLSANVYLKNLN